MLRAGCDRGQGRLTGQGVGTLSPGRGNLFSTAAADGATGGLQRTVGGSTLEAQVWLFRVYLLFKKNNKSFFRGWLSHAAPGPPSSRSFQTVASLSSLVLATLPPSPDDNAGAESEVPGTRGFASVGVHFRQRRLLPANIPGWPRRALCWPLPPPLPIPCTRAFGLLKLGG